MEVLIGIITYLFIVAFFWGFNEESGQNWEEFFIIFWPLTFFLWIIVLTTEYIITPILKFPNRLGRFIARKVKNVQT